MTSSAPWTAIRPSTTPTSPRPAANAISASRRPTTRAFTANCWPKGDPRGPVCTDCHTAHEIVNPDEQQFQGHQRRALRQMPRRPAGALPRHLPRQGHGAGPAQRRPGSRRLLRLPRLSRRPAAVRSRARICPRPTFWPPASNVIPAPPPSSPNTSRTPTRWTGSIIRCSTRCFWA